MSSHNHHTSKALERLRRQVEVHYVWTDQVMDPEILGAYSNLLSRQERRRHDRFRFEKDRHLYLIAHALVRLLLSQYAPVRPEDWVFYQNAYGRPEVGAPPTAPPLRFNLSHTRGLVACAVCLGHDIGIDVEFTERPASRLGIARRFFSPAEYQTLVSATNNRRKDRFFDLWTLKEAYIKARGMGLAIPLKQFSFTVDDHTRISISFEKGLEDEPAAWHFALMSPGPAHRMALAVRTRSGAVPVVWRCGSPPVAPSH